VCEYAVKLTSTFAKCMKKHGNRKKAVERVLRDLRRDPYGLHDSHPLEDREGQANLLGKRACHLFNTQFVLVFIVCEECVNQGHYAEGRNRCSDRDDCKGQPLKRLLVIAFEVHSKAYSNTWGF